MKEFSIKDVSAAIGEDIKNVRFNAIAEFCKKEFGMTASVNDLVEYLAGHYYNNQAQFGDEMSYHRKRYLSAQERMTQEEIDAMDEILGIMYD